MGSIHDASAKSKEDLEHLREYQRDALLQLEEEINPFTYDEELTVYEACKEAVLLFTLFPIRLFAGLLVLGIMDLISRLSLALGDGDDTKPMTRLQRFVFSFNRPLIRLFMFVMFGVVHIETKGKRDKNARILVAAPHSTAMDGFLVATVLDFPSAVAKDSVASIPLLGVVYKANQTIFVDREDGDAKQKVLEEMKRRANDPRWRPVFVFPEGTCTNRKALIQFRNGSFTAGLPIQPVLLRFPYKHFDPTWTSSGPNRAIMAVRLCCQFYNRVQVEFMPTYEPDEHERQEPLLYCNNVREAMAQRLGIGTTEHSYADSFFSMRARKLRLKPGKTLNFEISKFANLMQMSKSDAKELLDRYSEMMSGISTKSGQINVEQFAEILKLPLTSQVVDLFACLDVEGTGTIDFRHMIVGMSFLSRNTSVEESVDVLFEALDPEGNGVITAESLRKVLKKVFRKVDRKLLTKLFQEASPNGTMDRETLLEFLKKHPEYVHMGVQISSSYKSTHEPVEVLSAAAARELAQAMHLEHSKRDRNDKREEPEDVDFVEEEDEHLD